MKVVMCLVECNDSLGSGADCPRESVISSGHYTRVEHWTSFTFFLLQCRKWNVLKSTIICHWF